MCDTILQKLHCVPPGFAAAVLVLAGCSADAPSHITAPEGAPPPAFAGESAAFAGQPTAFAGRPAASAGQSAARAALPDAAQLNRALAELRRATARYHDLDAALADGFVFLHDCEVRPGEGPVGILYVHFDRLLDGRIDPALPDALLYEPVRNGKARLLGAELAIPYGMWPEPAPPEFFGHSFQPENEFGVWGLHVWLWRHNPEGMFAESHPGVSCDGA